MFRKFTRVLALLFVPAFLLALTSCVAVPLFEVDVIQLDITSSGTFGGATVTFRAVFDNAASYAWDFGDGTVGAGQVVVHTYSSEGTFTVRLEIATGSRKLVASKEIVIRSGSAEVIGQIEPFIIDSLEFDPVFGHWPDLIEVGPGVYAIAYTADLGPGFVTTFNMQDDGSIASSVIDTFEFDAGLGLEPRIIQVGSGIYAIAYYDINTLGVVITINIDDNGNIGGAIIDSLEYDSVQGASPDIIEVGPGVYAIAYVGLGSDGFVATVDIDASGNIGAAVTDTHEYNTSQAFAPDIIKVGDGVYAIAHQALGDDGRVTTVSIDSNGDIGNSNIESFVYADIGVSPRMIEIGNGIYAVTYRSNGQDGFVSTLSIDSLGDITNSVIDTLEYDTANGFEQSIIEVGNGVYAIAYRGNDDDGFVVTVRIFSDGVIASSIIDSFEFDPDHAEFPDIIQVSPGVFAIAYRGPDDDGFVVTIRIE